MVSALSCMWSFQWDQRWRWAFRCSSTDGGGAKASSKSCVLWQGGLALVPMVSTRLDFIASTAAAHQVDGLTILVDQEAF